MTKVLLLKQSFQKIDNMRVNNLSDLQIFSEIVKLGSFRAAGQKLNFSSAVVSKRLQRLESQLGVALIMRSTRSLSITEEGKKYFKHCQHIISAMNEAEADILSTNTIPSGTLSVSVPDYFGRLYVAPLVPKILKKYPQIDLSLNFSGQFIDIIAQGYDLAIRIGDLQDSNLIATKLASDQRVIVASKSYIDKFGQPNSPQDLVKHNILLFTNSNSFNIWKFNHTSKKQQNIKVSGNFQTNNCESLNQAVMAGSGIALRPRWDVYQHLKSGKLVELLAKFPTPALDIQAVYPSRIYLPYRTRVFIDELKHSLQQQVEWNY